MRLIAWIDRNYCLLFQRSRTVKYLTDYWVQYNQVMVSEEDGVSDKQAVRYLGRNIWIIIKKK